MNHIITSPLFKDFSQLTHGTSTKFFGPLSFRYSKNSNEIIIDRVKFLDELWLEATHSVLVCEQNHTENITKIDHEYVWDSLFDQSKQIPNTDWIVTNIPWINLVIYSADCMPISFFDPVQNVVWIVHSGWRWTIQWIWKKMVTLMAKHYNSDIWDIRVVVGPSIWPCCYEVKNQEQLKLFDTQYQNIISRNNTQYVDLWNSIEQDMVSLGIRSENFENQRICTSCNNTILASHRKDNPNSTVNLTVISLIH